MIDRAECEARQHLDQLFEHCDDEASGFGKMVAKYNGKRLNDIHKPHYQRVTDDRTSPIDPDDAPMQPSSGGSAVMKDFLLLKSRSLSHGKW